MTSNDTPAAPAVAVADRLDALKALLASGGNRFAEPAVLQPAALFLELAGEDLRRRMFLTAGAGGDELCLRPDFTIPVCNMHLRGGSADRPAGYAYLGPIFRQRADGPPESLQAGLERLGDADLEVADADVLARALEAVRLLGIARPQVRLGDEGLFTALIEALPLPQAWRRRLSAAFGDTARVLAALDRLEGRTGEAPAVPIAGALADADPETARALVENMLAVAGLTPVGGRSPGEIADRLVEQAALAAGARLAPEAARILRGYLAIAAPLDRAADAVAAFAAGAGLDLSAALERFSRRTALIAERGVETGAIAFAGEFGRRLDYYTGFMFEIHDRSRPAASGNGQIVGGGRYDRLLQLMGAGESVPAVGFSIWLERVVPARNEAEA
ncbi:ATP phosphoribosyltransferase regulatory subunit [Pseudoxanthobacter sp.]|uniref:ATP phosphoribosyltransferase regulatory subunit n=1 Tax=Pseudoxanthobacter sp. TaxID=1925742 RepID=UPI002FE0788C